MLFTEVTVASQLLQFPMRFLDSLSQEHRYANHYIMRCAKAVLKDYRRRHALDLLREILELYSDVEPIDAVRILLPLYTWHCHAAGEACSTCCCPAKRVATYLKSLSTTGRCC